MKKKTTHLKLMLIHTLKTLARIKKRLKTSKEVNRINNKKDRQYNVQKKKDKQWSTKHYTEN